MTKLVIVAPDEPRGMKKYEPYEKGRTVQLAMTFGQEGESFFRGISKDLSVATVFEHAIMASADSLGIKGYRVWKDHVTISMQVEPNDLSDALIYYLCIKDVYRRDDRMIGKAFEATGQGTLEIQPTKDGFRVWCSRRSRPWVEANLPFLLWGSGEVTFQEAQLPKTDSKVSRDCLRIVAQYAM